MHALDERTRPEVDPPNRPTRTQTSRCCCVPFNQQNTSGTTVGRGRKDSQLTAMLLLVSISLLILTIPIYGRYITYTFLDPEKDAKTFAVFVFAYNLTNKLLLTNTSINFVLYCLSGSKFRRDLATVMCRR